MLFRSASADAMMFLPRSSHRPPMRRPGRGRAIQMRPRVCAFVSRSSRPCFLIPFSGRATARCGASGMGQRHARHRDPPERSAFFRRHRHKNLFGRLSRVGPGRPGRQTPYHFGRPVCLDKANVQVLAGLMATAGRPMKHSKISGGIEGGRQVPSRTLFPCHHDGLLRRGRTRRRQQATRRQQYS